MTCVLVTTHPIIRSWDVGGLISSTNDGNGLGVGNSTSFTIEPAGLHAYVPDERVILFSHPFSHFYLPDIPEAARRAPDGKVESSLTPASTCPVTRRASTGVLAPLSWIYTHQEYFFGFPGEAILTILTENCNMASDAAILVCECLGRHPLALGDDITALTRVQRIPHFRHPSPILRPCDCHICK